MNEKLLQGNMQLIFLQISILIGIITAISGCNSITQPTLTAEPASPQSLAPEPATAEITPSSDLPISDKFNLASFDEKALMFKYDELPSQYPFNEYGLYYSQPFFLKEDEAFAILINSELPISVYNTEYMFSGGVDALTCPQKGYHFLC